MSKYSRKETLVIVNPAAHNVPSDKRLDEADRWLKAEGWQVEWRRTEGARQEIEAFEKAAANTPGDWWVFNNRVHQVLPIARAMLEGELDE